MEHQAIEVTLDILGTSLTLGRYRRLLASFHGFYAPVEKGIDDLGGWAALGFDPLARRKLGWLAEDLRALGISAPEALPECLLLPDLTSHPAALGCMYVLEGATSIGILTWVFPLGARNRWAEVGLLKPPITNLRLLWLPFGRNQTRMFCPSSRWRSRRCMDPRTPMGGLALCDAAANAAYASAAAQFVQYLEPNTGHTVTTEGRTRTGAWFVEWLKP